MNYSNLDTVFHSQDPDYIANTIQLELNTIYNILAPSKVVQYKSDHIPYYNAKIRQKLKSCDLMLSKAILSKEKDDWRNFRNFRNSLDKEIKVLKTEYIKSKMTDNKNNWKFLKKFNKCSKSKPPDRLIHNGIPITNPIELANMANNFFI